MVTNIRTSFLWSVLPLALASSGMGCGGGGESTPDAAAPPDAAPDAAPVAKVVISEIVADPVSDWSHSDGTGEPFVGIPGAGEVSATDEFIELYNAGTTDVDLTKWTLEIVDESPDTAEIAQSGMVVLVSNGSSLTSLKPGAFVLLGDPPGVLSNDVYLVLRDAEGNVMDDVELGGLTESRDYEGDGVGDGAPAPDQNGFATGSFDEAVARLDGSPDTDNDQADFDKAYATPLARNMPPMPPNDSQPPVVMATPNGTGYPVTQPLRVEFSEPIAAASLTGNLSVTAGGEEIPLGFATFEGRDRVVNLNPIGRLPYGQQITVTLRGGAAGIKDLAGNALAADQIFRVTTEAMAANPAPVVLNEICADPKQDWDDSVGGDGEKFSAEVGTGLVASDDEWIELYVNTTGAAATVDLSAYTLVVYNGPNLSTLPRVVTPMLSASGVEIRIVGTGTELSALRAGDRVIIGNPRGAILADTVIELRDGAGRLVDAVEIGGNTPETDRGGDGPMNGAPEPGKGGLSTGLADETIARSPDGADSGNDVDDFVFSAASLGAATP